MRGNRPSPRNGSCGWMRILPSFFLLPRWGAATWSRCCWPVAVSFMRGPISRANCALRLRSHGFGFLGLIRLGRLRLSHRGLDTSTGYAPAMCGVQIFLLFSLDVGSPVTQHARYECVLCRVCGFMPVFPLLQVCPEGKAREAARSRSARLLSCDIGGMLYPM